MASPKQKARSLTREELRRPFHGSLAVHYPPILAPAQLAELLGYSVSTVYFWLKAGRFDGAFRKRGKHIRIWRDRALEVFFSGSEWQSTGENPHG